MNDLKGFYIVKYVSLGPTTRYLDVNWWDEVYLGWSSISVTSNHWITHTVNRTW